MEKKLEILVVEDTPENLAVAKEFFNSQKDLNTDYATFRDEAIEKINSKKYDGVITDMSIPGYDGDPNQAFNYIRNNGWLVALNSELRNIPFIIHSEHGTSIYYVFPEKPSQDSLQKYKEIIEKGFEITDEGEYYDTIAPFEEIAAPWMNRELERIHREEFGFLSNEKLTKKGIESWVIALDYLKQRKKDPESREMALNYLKKRLPRSYDKI